MIDKIENDNYCKNCGARKSQSFKYCLHCGTSYSKIVQNVVAEPKNEPEKEPETEQVLKYCPTCGMEIIKEDIYCIECGNKNPTIKNKVNKEGSTNTAPNSGLWTVLLVIAILNATGLMPLSGIIALISLIMTSFSEEISIVFVFSAVYFIASIVFLVKSIKMNSKK